MFDVTKYPEVDYNLFFNLVYLIGPSLNGRKDRFDKSDILEKALEIFSDGRLAWVDREGHDHIIAATGELSEMKSQQSVLYTPSGRFKENTGKIRLTNFLGDKNDRSYEPKHDVLQVIDTGNPQTYSAAVVPAEVVKKYVEKTKDAFVVSIPIDELCFAFRPIDFKKIEGLVSLDYLTEKGILQERFIMSVKKVLDN